jgi:hypothetical protein
VVSFAGTVPTGGKTVSIKTPFGYTATLVHLGSIGVTRGAFVREASVVGTVGPSGVVDLTEPYVYFGTRVTSDPQGYVDPFAFLPPRAAPSAARSAPVADVASSPVAESAQAGTAPPVIDATTAVAVAPAAQAQAPVATEHPTAANAPAVAAVPEAASVGVAPHVRAATAARTAPAIHSTPQNTVIHAETGPASSRGERRLAESAGAARALAVSLASPLRHQDESSLRLHREPRTVPVAGTNTHDGVSHDWSLLAVGLAALTAMAGLMLAFRRRSARKAARIMVIPRPEQVLGRTAAKTTEDPGGAGLAVRSREEAFGPRGRVRGSRGHLCAVPPAEGQPRPDGERDGRARHAGDGHGRPRRRLAA